MTARHAPGERRENAARALLRRAHRPPHSRAPTRAPPAAQADATTRESLRTSEIKNGRLAMVAVTAYVVEELVTGTPVTQLTPLLFAPPWQAFGLLFGGQ